MHELPGHRLPARQVAVGLHPHPADRRPLSRLGGLLHPAVDLGLVLLHPGVLLGLRAGEDELGVVPGERGDVREGAGGLADRLPQRPEPGGVDVRVADRADPVRAGVCGPGQRRRQLGAGGARGTGDVVEVHGVQRTLQGAQDVVPARIGGRELVHQLGQHVQVQGQVPDLLVEHGEVGAGQPVQRHLASGPLVAERGGGEAIGEDLRVRRRLDQIADLLATRARGCDRDVGVRRLDALDRPAGEVVHQAFGLLPGQLPTKPRSITASTRRPAQSGGTRPRNRNHVVDHGGPQGAPTANGW